MVMDILPQVSQDSDAEMSGTPMPKHIEDNTSSRPKSKAQIRREKGLPNRRRGIHSSNPRGGMHRQLIGEDGYAADSERLLAKLFKNSKVFQTTAYSLEKNGNHVSTGWHGLNPSVKARKQLQTMYNSGKIKKEVAKLFPIPADLNL